MATYFFNMKTFGRAGGSSAVSAAAYRAGERLHDERTGRTYDHSQRTDVMHKEILVPAKLEAPRAAWAHDRETLWNLAEQAELRSNSRVAREFLVALPVELSAAQQISLARGFSRELTERYGSALDLAVHAPRDHPGSDPRNFHAHLLATTRELTAQGFGVKTAIDLNSETRIRLGLQSGRQELLYLRERWATVANEALREANIDARIDHRTLAAQGIEREPLPHIPAAAFHLERQGYISYAGERLRADYEARVAAREGRSPDLHARMSKAQISAKNWSIHRQKVLEAEVRSGKTAEQLALEAWQKYREKAQAAEERTRQRSARAWDKMDRDRPEREARARREAEKAWATMERREWGAESKPSAGSKGRSASRTRGRSRDDDFFL